MMKGHGEADYLLYANGQAVGVVEAKKVGATLTGVEVQSDKYGAGLPKGIPAPVRPLPFLYESTGVETRFTNRLDPTPKSREVFAFHRPETLAAWAAEEPLWLPLVAGKPDPRSERPANFRTRLTAMPGVEPGGLWPAQLETVRNLETSLASGRPRALIQMATGSGKTITAVASIYRLLKFGGAKRVLFLVDRANLGRQALKEFQSYRTPDDGRLFTELYNVQRNATHSVVCVTTGLLALLDHEELEGVIAHELAHIKNRDMLLQTIAATMAGAISNVANLAAFGTLFGQSDEEGQGTNPLASLLLMVVAPIAAMLIQFAISRQREFRADAVGAEICGRPRALAGALRKLERGARAIPLQVAPAGASLAIVNPLAAFGSARVLRWFSTHPSTDERIARLERLAGPTLLRVA